MEAPLPYNLDLELSDDQKRDLREIESLISLISRIDNKSDKMRCQLLLLEFKKSSIIDRALLRKVLKTCNEQRLTIDDLKPRSTS